MRIQYNTCEENEKKSINHFQKIIKKRRKRSINFEQLNCNTNYVSHAFIKMSIQIEVNPSPFSFMCKDRNLNLMYTDS